MDSEGKAEYDCSGRSNVFIINNVRIKYVILKYACNIKIFLKLENLLKDCAGGLFYLFLLIPSPSLEIEKGVAALNWSCAFSLLSIFREELGVSH